MVRRVLGKTYNTGEMRLQAAAGEDQVRPAFSEGAGGKT